MKKFVSGSKQRRHSRREKRFVTEAQLHILGALLSCMPLLGRVLSGSDRTASFLPRTWEDKPPGSSGGGSRTTHPSRQVSTEEAFVCPTRDPERGQQTSQPNDSKVRTSSFPRAVFSPASSRSLPTPLAIPSRTFFSAARALISRAADLPAATCSSLRRSKTPRRDAKASTP